MRREQLVGGVYATAAFGFWGLVPLYWREVRHVSGLEMVAHRILWAAPAVLLLVAWRKRLPEVVAALRDRAHLRLLALSALLLSVNWFVFVESIRRELVLEASLGYYVNPLAIVLLGTAVLKERLTRMQAAAVAVAAFGVTWLAVARGVVPWVALLLAGTFSVYGLLRKRAGVDSLTGLAVETALLVPVAAIGLAVLALRGESALLAASPRDVGLILLAGPVTALPLLWFAHAARRLRYVAIGFFQYLAPTGQLLLAVHAFGEPFLPAHGVAFSCIGVAAALYLADAVRTARRPAPAA